MEANELAKNILIDPDYDEFTDKIDQIKKNENDLPKEGFKKLFEVFDSCEKADICGKSFKAKSFHFSMKESKGIHHVVGSYYMWTLKIDVIDKNFLNQDIFKNIFEITKHYQIRTLANSINYHTFYKVDNFTDEAKMHLALNEFKDYISERIDARLEKSKRVLRLSEKIEEIL